MRGVLMLLLLGAVFAGAAGFGPVEELRITHPEFFKPGCVSVATNEGIAYYVCNGCATRFFRDIPVQHDPKLRTVAHLRAQNALSKFLLKGARDRAIEVSGLLQIAREVSAKSVFYVFAVPRENVKVVTNDAPNARTVLRETNAVPVGAGATLDRHDVVASAKTSGVAGDADDWLALLDAVERNPSDARSYARLSEIYLKAGEYDEAHRLYETRFRRCAAGGFCWIIEEDIP